MVPDQGSNLEKYIFGGEFLLASSKAMDKLTCYSSKQCVGGLREYPPKELSHSEIRVYVNHF